MVRSHHLWFWLLLLLRDVAGEGGVFYNVGIVLTAVQCWCFNVGIVLTWGAMLA